MSWDGTWRDAELTTIIDTRQFIDYRVTSAWLARRGTDNSIDIVDGQTIPGWHAGPVMVSYPEATELDWVLHLDRGDDALDHERAMNQGTLTW